MNNHLNADIFGYIDEYQRALCDPALEEFDGGSPSAEAKEAAARLAAALGFCRLFGLDPGEDDGTLPAPEALGAAEAVFQWVADVKEMVEELPRRWDEALDSIEADGLCADVLEGRMRIWAAEVALSEAALEAMNCADPLTDALNFKLDELASAVDELDRAIRVEEIMFLLSTLVGTALLENWRSMLVEPYSIVLPYWLDGTLEEFHRRSEELVRKSAAEFTVLMPRRVAAPQRSSDLIRNLVPIAVAADATSEKPPVILLRWESPDGKYLAELPVPGTPLVGQKLVLKIMERESTNPATELAKTPVNLAGIEGILTEQAKMELAIEALKEAAEQASELPLTVGGDRWNELSPLL
ncbi:MAG: hypothetical protein ACUVQG_13790 [Thermogutta sp.]